ncbi:hypothetical protein AB1L42_21535 [Thalassoglobus sp. JC818]|uniref:hypothetical protein n=1 Tax=Thalassoglobus sp. JC818 TaxID=3232136 RepID=UPI00345908AD
MPGPVNENVPTELIAMARNEADREDLFEEFRSARIKWEFADSASETVIVAGIRHDERLSVYFNTDPCYHFDAENRLMRAFVDGKLLRTHGTFLAQLNRIRTEQETVLQRHDMVDDELQELLSDVHANLKQFQESLVQNQLTVVRSSDEETDLSSLTERLEVILSKPIALAPPYPTRRK